MKRISTFQLIPGMTLSQSVLGFDHQLILTKGTVLTDQLISKLILYGIITVYVENDTPDKPHITFQKPEEISHSERIRQSPVFQLFKKKYEDNMEGLKDALHSLLEKSLPVGDSASMEVPPSIDISALIQSALDLADSGQGQIGILDMLQNMRDYDDATYAHSINVALMCNLFATWLKWSETEVNLATACGLFHDVGKLMVPTHILGKPGKLTDEEYAQIQEHPLNGYQLLRNQQLDEHIRNTALMHHERIDGSGYPMHLKGNQIDKFARLVAIVDVYDAMTAARVYRGPLCPFHVIGLFEAEGFRKYDVEYLLIFLENVVNTYVQDPCRLSDGREGEIIYINKEALSRPVVRCGSEYVNLSEEKDLTIDAIL